MGGYERSPQARCGELPQHVWTTPPACCWPRVGSTGVFRHLEQLGWHPQSWQSLLQGIYCFESDIGAPLHIPPFPSCFVFGTRFTFMWPWVDIFSPCVFSSISFLCLEFDFILRAGGYYADAPILLCSSLVLPLLRAFLGPGLLSVPPLFPPSLGCPLWLSGPVVATGPLLQVMLLCDRPGYLALCQMRMGPLCPCSSPFYGTEGFGPVWGFRPLHHATGVVIGPYLPCSLGFSYEIQKPLLDTVRASPVFLPAGCCCFSPCPVLPSPAPLSPLLAPSRIVRWDFTKKEDLDWSFWSIGLIKDIAFKRPCPQDIANTQEYGWWLPHTSAPNGTGGWIYSTSRQSVISLFTAAIEELGFHYLVLHWSWALLMMMLGKAHLSGLKEGTESGSFAFHTCFSQ